MLLLIALAKVKGLLTGNAVINMKGSWFDNWAEKIAE
jgi:hypothetical protein